MPYSNIIKLPNSAFETTTTTTTTPQPDTLIPVVQPSGLNYLQNDKLSNGLSSLLIAAASGITDFTIFNPYIHYYPSAGGGTGELDESLFAFTIQPSSLLIQVSQRFEIYSNQFRYPTTQLN
jgi:hypothetical protein